MQVKLARWLVAVCMLTGFLAFGQQPAANRGELKYAVIVTRHGVRPPLWTAEQLDPYSSAPWPKWDVPIGNLTAHGAEQMKLIGAYDRAHFVQAGLFRATGCADAPRVHIWADTDQRTIATGRALADGMLPGCKVEVHAMPDGVVDPLFSPLRAGVGRPNPEGAAAAIAGRIGGHPEALLEAYRPALETTEEVLLGCKPGPGCPPAGKISLFDIPAAIVPGKTTGEIRGPVATAASLAENFLLEYTNGMEGKDLGWGRLTEANLRQMMSLHAAYANLAWRTPFVARMAASNLLSHVLRSMEQAVAGKAVPGAMGKPGDRLLVIVGHDSNLANIGGVLDAAWLLPGDQPNDTPPGSALVFELWQQSGGGDYTVRSYFTAQTLEQMRKATPLTLEAPPATAPLFLAGCSSSAPQAPCFWKGFERTVEAAIDPAFVKLEAGATRK